VSAMPRSRLPERALLDEAFLTYVRSVEQIPQVMAVLADDGNEFSVTTVIKRRNLRVCARLFEIEQKFIELFSKLAPDFRILYAQDRPLEQIVTTPSSYRWHWIKDADKSATSRSSQP